MKVLQKPGKSLMLPVASLPVAAILMGIGYWIDPTGWGAVPGVVRGVTGMYMTGFFPVMMFGLPAAAIRRGNAPGQDGGADNHRHKGAVRRG